VKALLMAVAAGALSSGASASSYVDECSAMLSQKWHDAIENHPIDPAKHIPIVLVFVPQSLPEKSSTDALRGLAKAFPSFKEAPGSRIMLGCCSWPIFGSISYEDLAKLTAANFVPLCAVGVSSVQVRMEYRDKSEAGGAPYFWIAY
jgi:hypothetical protein